MANSTLKENASDVKTPVGNYKQGIRVTLKKPATVYYYSPNRTIIPKGELKSGKILRVSNKVIEINSMLYLKIFTLRHKSTFLPFDSTTFALLPNNSLKTHIAKITEKHGNSFEKPIIRKNTLNAVLRNETNPKMGLDVYNDDAFSHDDGFTFNANDDGYDYSEGFEDDYHNDDAYMEANGNNGRPRDEDFSYDGMIAGIAKTVGSQGNCSYAGSRSHASINGLLNNPNLSIKNKIAIIGRLRSYGIDNGVYIPIGYYNYLTQQNGAIPPHKLKMNLVTMGTPLKNRFDKNDSMCISKSTLEHLEAVAKSKCH